MLPLEMKRQAVAEARKLKVSFADYVRQALKEKLPGSKGLTDRLKRRRRDPVFQLLDTLPPIKTPHPSDIAANHDEYLYGKKSEFGGK